ncbi:hypothetical protein FVE85_9155 [Porphyridium purpureum]|uniref:Uncharacterized protein n=1 Tax=Porphyridium purpureum TaxID=35688 RepID=A0A5J4YQ53_PORPP|nr:hypothetical protein FVE85_9155 [Porphyridium purpureum]|eukprot:POR6593..scf222_8
MCGAVFTRRDFQSWMCPAGSSGPGKVCQNFDEAMTYCTSLRGTLTTSKPACASRTRNSTSELSEPLDSILRAGLDGRRSQIHPAAKSRPDRRFPVYAIRSGKDNVKALVFSESQFRAWTDGVSGFIGKQCPTAREGTIYCFENDAHAIRPPFYAIKNGVSAFCGVVFSSRDFDFLTKGCSQVDKPGKQFVDLDQAISYCTGSCSASGKGSSSPRRENGGLQGERNPHRSEATKKATLPMYAILHGANHFRGIVFTARQFMTKTPGVSNWKAKKCGNIFTVITFFEGHGEPVKPPYFVVQEGKHLCKVVGFSSDAHQALMSGSESDQHRVKKCFNLNEAVTFCMTPEDPFFATEWNELGAERSRQLSEFPAPALARKVSVRDSKSPESLFELYNITHLCCSTRQNAFRGLVFSLPEFCALADGVTGFKGKRCTDIDDVKDFFESHNSSLEGPFYGLQFFQMGSCVLFSAEEYYACIHKTGLSFRGQSFSDLGKAIAFCTSSQLNVHSAERQSSTFTAGTSLHRNEESDTIIKTSIMYAIANGRERFRGIVFTGKEFEAQTLGVSEFHTKVCENVDDVTAFFAAQNTPLESTFYAVQNGKNGFTGVVFSPDMYNAFMNGGESRQGQGMQFPSLSDAIAYCTSSNPNKEIAQNPRSDRLPLTASSLVCGVNKEADRQRLGCLGNGIENEVSDGRKIGKDRINPVVFPSENFRASTDGVSGWKSECCTSFDTATTNGRSGQDVAAIKRFYAMQRGKGRFRGIVFSDQDFRNLTCGVPGTRGKRFDNVEDAVAYCKLVDEDVVKQLSRSDVTLEPEIVRPSNIDVSESTHKQHLPRSPVSVHVSSKVKTGRGQVVLHFGVRDRRNTSVSFLANEQSSPAHVELEALLLTLNYLLYQTWVGQHFGHLELKLVFAHLSTERATFPWQKLPPKELWHSVDLRLMLLKTLCNVSIWWEPNEPSRLCLKRWSNWMWSRLGPVGEVSFFTDGRLTNELAAELPESPDGMLESDIVAVDGSHCQMSSKRGIGVYFGPDDARNIAAGFQDQPTTSVHAEMIAGICGLEQIISDSWI